jgi:hypothetical protein
MALLLAVVMGLIPLAIAPGCFFYFDVTPKVVLLLLGTAAAAIWWAAAGGAQGFYPGSRAARWFLVALCGMAVSLAVSTLASVNPAVSLGGGNWRYWGLVTQLAALGFAYMVAACCAGRPGRLRVILRGIAVSGLLVAGYGIAQYFGWDPLLDARGYHVGEGIWTIVRPPATLGHADYSANWLLFVVFAAAALAVSEPGDGWRWLAWPAVAIGAGSVAMVLSGTRAAIWGWGLVAGSWASWASGGEWLPSRRKPTPAQHGWGRRFRLPFLALAIGDVAGAALAAFFYLSPAGEPTCGRASTGRSRNRRAGRAFCCGATACAWRPRVGRRATDRRPSSPVSRFINRRTSAAPIRTSITSRRTTFCLDALVAQGVAGPVLLLALAASGFAAAWTP